MLTGLRRAVEARVGAGDGRQRGGQRDHGDTTGRAARGGDHENAGFRAARQERRRSHRSGRCRTGQTTLAAERIGIDHELAQ